MNNICGRFVYIQYCVRSCREEGKKKLQLSWEAVTNAHGRLSSMRKEHE